MSSPANMVTNNNGLLKVVAAVSILLSVCLGVFAMVRPMSQSIENIGLNLSKDLATNEAEIIRIRNWVAEHDRIIERRDAEQWERLKALERAVYGHRGEPWAER